MKDWEDNTDDEVMREHAEENAFRAHYPPPFDMWRKDIIEQFANVDGEPVVKPRWRCGFLFRPGSLWVGAHWAGHNKRLCLNLIPMVTFWVTLPGGVPPR